MFCQKCGTKNQETAKFCGNCGATVALQADAVPAVAPPAASVTVTTVKKTDPTAKKWALAGMALIGLGIVMYVGGGPVAFVGPLISGIGFLAWVVGRVIQFMKND